MKKKGRYDVSESVEAQFEPGSNDTVLKNKLGITDPIESLYAEIIETSIQAVSK